MNNLRFKTSSVLKVNGLICLTQLRLVISKYMQSRVRSIIFVWRLGLLKGIVFSWSSIVHCIDDILSDTLEALILGFELPNTLVSLFNALTHVDY